jgi:HAD superfamily hydrolase (TIGR01509 family)
VSEGRGLFLDLDGTLANSLSPLKDVYFSFLSRRGVSGSKDEFQRLNGLPLVDIIETLVAAHKLCGDSAELKESYSAMMREAQASAPPAPGARMLIGRARTNGWRVAVVTSAQRLWTTEWLERTALLDQVDVVVGGDDVICGKPSPEPYRLALARTRCAPANSLAVEDSKHGACAALAAGLPTWVIAPTSRRGTEWPIGVKLVAGLGDLMEKL